MPEQIYIGNFAKGLQTNVEPFNLDNSAFPFLFNFYAWRGKIQRKRGTAFLGQLRAQVSISATPNQFQYHSFTLNGSGFRNIISALSLESTSTIAPGTVSLSDGTQIYTDPNKDGTLVGSLGGVGQINYATGTIFIVGDTNQTITGTFSYFPGLPVMGLRDFSSTAATSTFPILLAFDTTRSYQVNDNGTTPAAFYETNYYKNTNIPFFWSGQDFQQFWTTNYEGALWATNNKPGFHFLNISSIVVGNPTTIHTAAPNQLITGDFIFINGVTGADGDLLNKQTFQVTVAGGGPGQASFTILVDTTGKAIDNDGIFQLLTNSVPGQDGIKWYDGDPTSATGLPTGTGKGWVNFAPPLTGAGLVSIDTLTPALYYLVGALAIVSFKDRLLFFSPWIQSANSAAIQLKDTVLWSWNGTPYYNSLVPINQTFDVRAFYVDQTGLGGYLSAGVSQPIATIGFNEDLILIGFGGNGRKTRFAYTGNDIQPFLFYTINSELPSSATFSSINFDRGMMDIGPYGIAITDQQSSRRVDVEIPDYVFQIQNLNNGAQRVCAVRNFQKEWIYFCYPVTGNTQNGAPIIYPTQSFFYNYRENTWAVMYENFTAFGAYRPQSKRSWTSLPFKSWETWREPWNAGNNSALYRDIIGGTPQGYVLFKDKGTGEGVSCSVISIGNNSGFTQVQSFNHCLLQENPNTGMGDFVLFSGAVGSSPAGRYINGQIGKVITIVDANNFVVDIPYQTGGNTAYFGLGQFAKLSQPYLQTKQFNPYWEQGRKVRICAQKYLFEKTAKSQVTLNIFLSQDTNDPWNDPITEPPSNPLIYSTLLYTCPESTNLGLTPVNTNLQMPLATQSNQIWHRYNQSLIGDSVQIGVTLNEQQMKTLLYATDEITLHGIHLTVERSSLLA